MAALTAATRSGRPMRLVAEHELLAEVTGKLYDLDCVLGLDGWDDELEDVGDWLSTPSPASSTSGSQVVTACVHDLPSAPAHTVAAAGQVPVSDSSTPAGSFLATPQHSPPADQHNPPANQHTVTLMESQPQPDGADLHSESGPASVQVAEGEPGEGTRQEATQQAEAAGTYTATWGQVHVPTMPAPAPQEEEDDDLPSLPSAAAPPPPPAKPALPTVLYIPPPPVSGHSQLEGRAHCVYGPYAQALGARSQQATSRSPSPPEHNLLLQHALLGDGTETDESSRPTTPTTPTTPGTSGGEEGGVRRKKKRELATYLRDRGMGSRPGTPTGRQHMAAVSPTVSNVCPEDSPWMDFRLVFDPILSGMVGPNGLPTRPPIYHAIHCRHTENVCTKKDPRSTAPSPRRLFLAEVPAFARPNLMAGLVAGPAAPLPRAPTPTSAPQSRASSPATVLTAGTRSSSQSPLAPTVESGPLQDQWAQQQTTWSQSQQQGQQGQQQAHMQQQQLPPQQMPQQMQQMPPQQMQQMPQPGPVQMQQMHPQQMQPMPQHMQQQMQQMSQMPPQQMMQQMHQVPQPGPMQQMHPQQMASHVQPMAQATPPRALQATQHAAPPAAHLPPQHSQPAPQASPQRHSGPAGSEGQGAAGRQKRSKPDSDRGQAGQAKAGRWEYEEETCLEEGHWAPPQQQQQPWAQQTTSTSSQIHREWFEAVAKDTQRRGGRGVGRNTSGSSGEEKDEARLKTVFVGDLPQGTSKDELGQLFEPHGVVEELRIFPGKNYAFVVYTCFEHAERAISAMDGFFYRGNQLRVARGGRRGFCKREWTDTDTNTTNTRAGGESGGGGSFDDELRALLKRKR